MNLPELPPAERARFNQHIWLLAGQVPPGKVATYGQLAAYVPLPPGVPPDDFNAHRARWAGAAMAASPAGVPWQRIINAQGKISLRQGAETQRRLLEAEGVAFDARSRVDLARFGWAGPDPDWLRANGLLVP